MTDVDDGDKFEDRTVASLARLCRDIALSTSSRNTDSKIIHLHDTEKMVYLVTMSHAISSILAEEKGCKDLAKIWQELTIALGDVVGGKSAELFKPLKEPNAQPRRISLFREAYFSMAAAVYDLAEADEKSNVLEELAEALKVKPAQLHNFRRNLTRGNPQIKSSSAIKYYDDVLLGNRCVDKEGYPKVDENGDYIRSPGKPSPASDWLKWFNNKDRLEV
jgi:hypothetical protein